MRLTVLVGVAILAACSDAVTSPAPNEVPLELAFSTVAPPEMPATLRWNAVARELVSAHRTTPPPASRVYALLSAAQHDAAANASDRLHTLSGRVAAASASATVLAFLYADSAEYILGKLESEKEAVLALGMRHGSVNAAVALGRVAAKRVVQRARTDGSDLVWTANVPTGSCSWFSSVVPPQPPLLPRWGEVRPWLLTAGMQFRAPPPPKCESQEFLEAVLEVRRTSDQRTQRQLEIAQFWADGPGTYTPAGHWNAIAATLIVRDRLSERAAAHVMALMNIAMMDAGIAVWDAKYAYWLLRPSQAAAGITLPIGLPNFPSYPSGHSGFSGAASEVLAYFFPTDGDWLRTMAEEAGLSRLYGGIHYRFDSDAGLAQGRAVARWAIARFAEEVCSNVHRAHEARALQRAF